MVWSKIKKLHLVMVFLLAEWQISVGCYTTEDRTSHVGGQGCALEERRWMQGVARLLTLL